MRKLLDTLNRRRRNRDAYEALLALDAHRLADLGITRHDLVAARRRFIATGLVPSRRDD